MTSGRVVAGVRSPAAGLASTTWNRMPLAWTSRCRHGPSMRVIEGSGGLELGDGGRGGTLDLRSGPVVAAEHRAGLLDGFDGLLGAADFAHLAPAEQAEYPGAQQHADKNDQERHPPPDPGVQQFCHEEEEEEGGVQQDHTGKDEENTAGHALLDVPGDLRAGQFDFGADQGRDLGGGVPDQLTDRRISGKCMRIDQRYRCHCRGHALGMHVAVTIAHGTRSSPVG